MLPQQLNGIANIHLDALEHNNSIAFMHSVQEGAASKSYGLAVAALAGVPQSVIRLAKQKLTQLENGQPVPNQNTMSPAETAAQGELMLMDEDEKSSALVTMLQQVDPDDLTPKQALAYLYQLKKML